MADPYVRNTQAWLTETYPDLAGVGDIDVDGLVGQATINALILALQHELHVSPPSPNFGPATLAAVQSLGPVDNSISNKKIISIVQGAMYCKGYNAGNGELDGVWGTLAVAYGKKLREDMGLAGGDGSIPPKVLMALMNLDAFVLTTGGNAQIQAAQRAFNGRYYDRRDYYIVPADGHFERKLHQAHMLAVQYEIGLADGVATGNYGPATRSGLASADAQLSVGSSDSTKFFVHLFKAALIFNGYSVTFNGVFDAATASQTTQFQNFVGLPVSGEANRYTWGSLLVSSGDPTRSGTGADMITTLNSTNIEYLQNAGYTHFGRYLFNTPDDRPDKGIKYGELEDIFAVGGRVFPIFQTGGGTLSHFTRERGRAVGEEAANAAWAYRVPANTVIYFSVDFDVSDDQITNSVIPYFEGVGETIGTAGVSYRVGIYGPRNACTRISSEGLAVHSFVSDMSVLYQGNLGHRLPSNWAFDQIQTTIVGAPSTGVEIDKNIVSGRDNGFASLGPAHGVGNDPVIPASRFDEGEKIWFEACARYPDSDIQRSIMDVNRPRVATLVKNHDSFITELAATYQVYKALIMTPLIWESMVWNSLDASKDELVDAYYIAKRAGLPPGPDSLKDSSTGPCQIFAETAMTAWNWAIDRQLAGGSKYDLTRWQEWDEVWHRLRDDQEFNLTTALYVTLHDASNVIVLEPGVMRRLTPSNIQSIYVRYNGGLVYGRSRTQLYYAIQRFEESLR